MASASHPTVAAARPDPRRTAASVGGELDRLEDAVRGLVEERAALSRENVSMREELEAMRGLQERLLAESLLRQDALKRIDDLVGLIDQLDPALAKGGK